MNNEQLAIQSRKIGKSESAGEGIPGRHELPKEPLLDCATAALLLGGVHPKTIQKWAREGRIPAYRFFRRWCFRASELEVWLSSHVHSQCHPCRFQKEESDGT